MLLTRFLYGALHHLSYVNASPDPKCFLFQPDDCLSQKAHSQVKLKQL